MKTKIIISIIFCSIFLLTFNKKSNAQASTAALTATPNVHGGAEFLGWTNAFPLDFQTVGVLRMTILGTGNVGYVGIGNTFTAPKSRLHIREAGDNTSWFQMTGNNTGSAATNGLRIGVLNPAGGPYDVEFRQQENAPMRFFTNDSSSVKERMKLIFSKYNDQSFNGIIDSNVTRVGISYVSTYPRLGSRDSLWSMLHMGRNDSPYLIRRPWMNVGTSYTDNFDAMYVGMNRDTGQDQTDAVIAWADNNFPEAGPDNLRFIFLAQVNGSYGQPGTREGQEMGRFAPTGNFGVGNFYNSPSFPPVRRIEALDMASNAPQLRLTHVQANPANITTTGAWTDFQTTSLGDLYIHPDSATINRRVGINTSTPQRTLEINSNDANPSPGNSGLRLTDLTTASTPITNPFAPNPAVLSVDSVGDVILVPDDDGDLLAADNGLTVIPAGTGGDPTVTRHIHLEGFLHKTTNIDMFNGTPAYTLTLTGHPGYVKFGDYAVTGADNIGIQSLVSENSIDNYGMQSLAAGNQKNIGNYCFASGGSTYNYGVYSQGGGTSAGTPATLCSAGSTSPLGTPLYVGGLFKSEAGNTTGTNVAGIFTACSNSSTNIGIYALGNGGGLTYSGFFDGPIFANAISMTTGNVLSDQMFKTNVATIPNAMDLITQLQPKSFFMDTTNIYGMQFSSKKQYGLIAQEVEPILPELVKDITKPAGHDDQGNEIIPQLTFKTLNYNSLFGIILKGMQELKAQNDALTAQVNSCCVQPRTNGDAGANKATIELENIASLILFEADPNPFSESTTIRFNIPNDFKNAVMYFYDNNGNRINTYEIKDKGQGELQVFGSKLSSGIYTYTLVIDGKVIDSKKMLKAK